MQTICDSVICKYVHTHYSNSQMKMEPRNVAVQHQTDYTATGVPVAVTLLYKKNDSARWWNEAILACFKILFQYYLTECTMDTGSFPGVKSGRDVTLTPHPLLVPWS